MNDMHEKGLGKNDIALFVKGHRAFFAARWSGQNEIRIIQNGFKNPAPSVARGHAMRNCGCIGLLTDAVAQPAMPTRIGIEAAPVVPQTGVD